MGSVITLEGLRTTSPDVSEAKCSTTTTAYSPTIGKDVEVCVEAVTSSGMQSKPKQRRGRPKGSTVKKGAKKPKVSSCSSTKWVTRGKRSYCVCTDKGNSQIQPHSSCGKDKKPKSKES